MISYLIFKNQIQFQLFYTTFKIFSINGGKKHKVMCDLRLSREGSISRPSGGNDVRVWSWIDVWIQNGIECDEMSVYGSIDVSWFKHPRGSWSGCWTEHGRYFKHFFWAHWGCQIGLFEKKLYMLWVPTLEWCLVRTEGLLKSGIRAQVISVWFMKTWACTVSDKARCSILETKCRILNFV